MKFAYHAVSIPGNGHIRTERPYPIVTVQQYLEIKLFLLKILLVVY